MRKITLIIMSLVTLMSSVFADISMQNIFNRNTQSLNGEWNILPDMSNIGAKRKWWVIPDKNQKGLAEVDYEGWYTLNVPGDWNHQLPEFTYYQGCVWYQTYVDFKPKANDRVFLHFSGVSHHCDVYLNEKKLGSHKGAYTQFQFEVTDIIKEGKNSLVVRVDNELSNFTVPIRGKDWFNYGGITRDVNLVFVPENYIYDYTVGLANNDTNMLNFEVKLNGEDIANKSVTLSIPEAKIQLKLKTDKNGFAKATKKVDLQLWDCENPKLYDVQVATDKDSVKDQIGFRTIQTKGDKLFLNGKPVFLRGINIHEEIASQKRRAYSQADATFAVQQARELNCNFVRLAHFSPNEYMVREAERNGIMLWSEIPLWQGVAFHLKEVRDLGRNMLTEMISRDKNRCAIILWSVSNETGYWSKDRNKFLPELANYARELDPTRLVTSALDKAVAKKIDGTYYMQLDDPLIEALDVVGINKYMGWYANYPCDAKDLHWDIAKGKPVIMSEFGAGCKYGNTEGGNNKNYWNEDYMEQNYKDNLASFKNFPNLIGTSPWLLFDFQSAGRPHAKYQQGWNRKGLIDPGGGKKKAWFVLKNFYDQVEASSK